MTTSLEHIYVDDLIEQLHAHPIYDSIHSERSLRIFMRAHVFCVWDFQSLLTALQRELTCVSIPWLPTADPEARRLINEIVLDEESDINPQGGYFSHFELYLTAMRNCGADVDPIERLIAMLRRGDDLETALLISDLPPGVLDFVKLTLDVARSGQPHRVVASFTLGREDLIPEMFTQFVQGLSADAPESWSLFLYYLNRHIETDGERHGPLSLALLSRLCGEDERLWAEAEETARAALEARIRLWDAIYASISATPNETHNALAGN